MPPSPKDNLIPVPAIINHFLILLIHTKITESFLSLQPLWLRSTMDSMWVSGTQDLGSIPGGATDKHKITQAFAWVFYFQRNA